MKTNFTLKGRLAFDPKVFATSKGGVIANFSVVYSQKDHQAVFIPCVSLDSDLSEQIISNYQKGDWIIIVNATPTVFDSRLEGYKAGLKFIVWELGEEDTPKKTAKPQGRPPSKTQPTKGVPKKQPEPEEEVEFDDSEEIPF